MVMDKMAKTFCDVGNPRIHVCVCDAWMMEADLR